jgi:hypothetical protein
MAQLEARMGDPPRQLTARKHGIGSSSDTLSPRPFIPPREPLIKVAVDRSVALTQPNPQSPHTLASGQRSARGRIATLLDAPYYQPMPTLSLEDLIREIRDLAARESLSFERKEDDQFLYWFLRAYVTSEGEAAARALTGFSGEKNLDAVYIDDQAKAVYLVQGKFHKSIMSKQEKLNDILGFCGLASRLVSDEASQPFLAKLEPQAKQLVLRARERLLSRGYRLLLYYVTTGRCSSGIVEEGHEEVAKARLPDGVPPEFDLLDGSRILAILENYLRGLAPALPTLRLTMEDGAFSHFDESTQLESWVFSVPGSEFAALLERLDDARPRLYALNIRGFLGETKVNKEIERTLQRTPEYFWYFNNGVTIVCDGASAHQERGKRFLNLQHPQIINGQQTTRALHQTTPGAGKAKVLVRVIAIPPGWSHGSDSHDQLVSRIVRATNWQNAIGAADLRSNDDVQIWLQNELRPLGVAYARKRQTRAEAKLWAGNHAWLVTKEEMASAVAGCLYESMPLRLGNKKLFEDPQYKKIFTKKRLHRYACCYLLSRIVDQRSGKTIRGKKTPPEWRRGKFVVLYFLWQRFGEPLLERADRFIEASKSRRDREPLLRDLDSAAEYVFRAVAAYYSKDSGKGADRVEPTVFFKRQDVFRGFERHWRSPNNQYRSKFTSAEKNVNAALKKPLAS